MTLAARDAASDGVGARGSEVGRGDGGKDIAAPREVLAAQIERVMLSRPPAGRRRPIGLTTAGLPVGVQIVAPSLEDRTAIDVGDATGDVIGGLQPPRRY